MSQNVPIKKIQVATRQSKVANLYLKNISIKKMSEIFEVDRKTIQRDLQQVKFNFRRNVPSEQAYKIVRLVLFEHNIMFDQAINLLQQSKDHQQAIEYLKLMRKLWSSKTGFLAKIGLFDGIPEMLGPEHDLFKDISDQHLKSLIGKKDSEESLE